MLMHSWAENSVAADADPMIRGHAHEKRGHGHGRVVDAGTVPA